MHFLPFNLLLQVIIKLFIYLINNKGARESEDCHLLVVTREHQKHPSFLTTENVFMIFPPKPYVNLNLTAVKITLLKHSTALIS